MSECSLTYAASVSPRASALPPSERRVSIVRAALRLIAANGTMPTTREIAEGAEIAEGTIFRAFDTKERLVEAVVGETFCPAPISVQMEAIDPDQPLRERLVALVTVLQGRFTEIFGVMSALGLTAPPADYEEHRGCRPDTGHIPVDEQDPSVDAVWAAVQAAFSPSSSPTPTSCPVRPPSWSGTSGCSPSRPATPTSRRARSSRPRPSSPSSSTA